jgi:hypothetical protein
MNEKSRRRRLEQAKRAVALLNDPVTTERLEKLVKDLEEQLRADSLASRGEAVAFAPALIPSRLGGSCSAFRA